jgi:hypothetical protein
VLEVIGNQVYLINKDSDGTRPQPIQKPPLIFEDFVHFVRGTSKGQLTAEQSLYSTRVSLLAGSPRMKTF